MIPHEAQKRSNFLPISGETATVELRGVLGLFFFHIITVYISLSTDTKVVIYYNISILYIKIE